MKPFRSLLLLSLLCFDVAASTIGKVIDDATGLPLDGVKISIVNRNTVEPQYSSIYGLFEIDAQSSQDGPKDTLRFEKAGFAPLDMPVNNHRVLYARLSPLVIEQAAPLDTLLSTAGRSAQKVSQIPASVVVVTRQEIAAMGYNDIEEILVNVPGIYSIEEYDWTGGGSNIGVRGFLTSGMNNSMMIMVNGVTQFEDYWGFYPLSRINVPVETIERIEIVRGPMSVVYGSGALLGAINIITRQNSGATEATNDNSIALTTDTNQTQRLSFRINSSGKLSQTFIGSFESGNDADFDLSRLSNNDNIQILATDALAYRKTYLNIAGDYQNRVSFNASLSQADKGILLNVGTIPVLPQTDRQSAHLLGFNFHLSSQQFWADDALRTKSALSYYTHISNQDYSAGQSFYGFTSYRSSAYQIEFDTFIDGRQLWQAPLNLSLGLMHRSAIDLHTTFDLLNLANSDRYIRMHQDDQMQLQSIYGQIDYQWTEKLMLTAGLRIELGNDYRIIYGKKCQPQNTAQVAAHPIATDLCPVENDHPLLSPIEDSRQYQHPGITNTPRVGLLYSPDEDSVVKLLYGKGVRQPSFGQNSDVLINNKKLTHEQVDAFELIYLSQYGNGTEGVAINTQASLFYNRLSGLIFRQSSEVYDSDSTGGTTLGLEVSADLSYRQTKASVALSYQQSEPEPGLAEFNLSVPISPKWLGYAKLSWQYDQGKTLAASIRYIDKMYNDFQTITDSQNNTLLSHLERNASAQSDSALLLDMHLNLANFYQLPVNLSLSLKNLFNRHYRLPLTLNSSWADQGFSGSGRRFAVALQYQF